MLITFLYYAGLLQSRGNRIINPSFRRKPESRTLGSRFVLCRVISWIPAFAGTTVAWVALVKTQLPWRKAARVHRSAHPELVEG